MYTYNCTVICQWVLYSRTGIVWMVEYYTQMLVYVFVAYIPLSGTNWTQCAIYVLHILALYLRWHFKFSFVCMLFMFINLMYRISNTLCYNKKCMLSRHHWNWLVCCFVVVTYMLIYRSQYVLWMTELVSR